MRIFKFICNCDEPIRVSNLRPDQVPAVFIDVLLILAAHTRAIRLSVTVNFGPHEPFSLKYFAQL